MLLHAPDPPVASCPTQDKSRSLFNSLCPFSYLLLLSLPRFQPHQPPCYSLSTPGMLLLFVLAITAPVKSDIRMARFFMSFHSLFKRPILSEAFTKNEAFTENPILNSKYHLPPCTHTQYSSSLLYFSDRAYHHLSYHTVYLFISFTET